MEAEIAQMEALLSPEKLVEILDKKSRIRPQRCGCIGFLWRAGRFGGGGIRYRVADSLCSGPDLPDSQREAGLVRTDGARTSAKGAGADRVAQRRDDPLRHLRAAVWRRADDILSFRAAALPAGGGKAVRKTESDDMGETYGRRKKKDKLNFSTNKP